MLLHALLIGGQNCSYCRITFSSKSIFHNCCINFPQFFYKPVIVLLARSRDTHSFEAAVWLLILSPHFRYDFVSICVVKWIMEENWTELFCNSRIRGEKSVEKVRKSNVFWKDNSNKFSTPKWKTFPWADYGLQKPNKKPCNKPLIHLESSVFRGKISNLSLSLGQYGKISV